MSSVTARVGVQKTVADLARMAGVSRRTVFPYFRTRDELMAKAAVAGQTEFNKSLPPYGGMAIGGAGCLPYAAPCKVPTQRTTLRGGSCRPSSILLLG